MFDFSEIIKPVESELDELIVIIKNTLHEDDFALSLFFENFVNAPSKKIRPLLCILFAKALYGELTEYQMSCACGAEMIHGASLIHDDIVDGANLRRGMETLNCIHDSRLAVLAGDFVLSKAVKILSSIPNPFVFQIFSEAILKMTKAEISQFFSRYKQISLREYIEKTQSKTAELFSASVHATLSVHDSSRNFSHEIKNATEYALNFGIAFQIKDDLASLNKKNTLKPNNDNENGLYFPSLSLPIENQQCLLDDYIQRASKCLEVFKQSPYRDSLSELLNYLRDKDE